MDNATDEAVKPRLSEAEDEFLHKARDLFKRAEDAHDENRNRYQDDINLWAGTNHWPTSVKDERARNQQACLTINRMKGFVRQVTNDERQNRPSIRIKPVDDKADPETAEVLQGIVRHIEVSSHADVAYDNAFFHCVAGGFGYWRILTDYIPG